MIGKRGKLCPFFVIDYAALITLPGQIKRHCYRTGTVAINADIDMCLLLIPRLASLPAIAPIGR